MRAPGTVLVIDAAILVAAARGRSTGAILEAARTRSLVTSGRAVEEAARRIELGMMRPELLPVLKALVDELIVLPAMAVEAEIAQAEMTLRDAVPSRNGSVQDAHILSLAWQMEADIWTFDRDFAGTGVASWSTVNLMRALVDAAHPRAF